MADSAQGSTFWGCLVRSRACWSLCCSSGGSWAPPGSASTAPRALTPASRRASACLSAFLCPVSFLGVLLYFKYQLSVLELSVRHWVESPLHRDSITRNALELAHEP